MPGALVFFNDSPRSWPTITMWWAKLVLSASKGLPSVITVAVLYGIGFGSVQPALQASIVTMVPRERFGIANASFFTAFDLGIALGSTLLGGLAGWLGYRALFVAGAASVAIYLAVFVAYVRPLLRPGDEVAS